MTITSTSIIASPVTPASFVSVFRGHPAGVAVVTADSSDGPVAFVASSITSLSAEPAYLSFSISDATTAAPALAYATSVVVHFFGAEGLAYLRLAARSGSERFGDSVPWARLDSGEPVLLDARSWIRGTVEHRVRAGTATLHVVRAIETGGRPSGDRAVVYHDRSWHELGAHSRIET